MSKFKNGATVRVTDNGKLYSAYTDFINAHARDFIGEWEKWRGIASGSIGRIVAQAKHPSYNDYLYVIKTKDGVFIMSEHGLELAPKPPQSTPLEQAAERYALAVKMCVMCGSTCSAGNKRKNDCPFKGVDKKGFNCQQYAAILPETQKVMEDYLAAEAEQELFNGKVVCAEVPFPCNYTAGKVYTVKDGYLIDDEGNKQPSLNTVNPSDTPLRSFADMVSRAMAKWVEFKGEQNAAEQDKPTEPKQVVKLYCALPLAHWLTAGKIYESVDGWVTVDDGGSYRTGVMIGEKYLFPMVQRPAKVGEWVYIVDGKGNSLPNGSVLRCIGCTDSEMVALEYSGHTNWDTFNFRYLVLDGYKGE